MMGIDKVAGFGLFFVGFFAATRAEPVDRFLDSLGARICFANAGASPDSALAAGWAARTPTTPVACPPVPTGYGSLPSVTGPGDLSVPLALGTGAGVGTNNPNLCFQYESLPAAPVIRVVRGNTLTVGLTNTLLNTGTDNTENCTIDNYPLGPPVSGTCPPTEEQYKALPGPDGKFYPIQADIRHLADGTVNLHVHGFSVSARPCHDEVVRSTLYAANWAARIKPLLPCQSAPNELTYTYDIPADHPEGLYWYHAHRHGQAFSETMMGATGAIVIEGEADALRAAHGVTDDVMVVRDFPASYVTSTAPRMPFWDVVAQRYTHERGHTEPASPAVDPRIDRDNELSCKTTDPDAGGEEFTHVTLNGALVQETAQFPPPDSQVLVKTMTVGERQLWRLANSTAETYISPQLVLSVNGTSTVQPLVITAMDGVPVHDDNGNRRNLVVDTTKHPLLLATANRLEFLVHAPPAGGTLYLDSQQVIPGCTGDSMPERRLLRVVSTQAKDGSTVASAAPKNDEDILAKGVETQYVHMLDTAPDVRRVFAFTEYSHPFTVSKSIWIKGPPANPRANIADFYLTQTRASDGQGKPVSIRPFDPHSGADPDVIIHLRGQKSVTEDWIIQNYTLQLHNFHIHQMHFRDMTPADRIDGVAPLLDTVNVPAATRVPSSEAGVDVPGVPGFVRLRLQFTRKMVGTFVFHCHLLAHEDGGMMKRIQVLAD